MPLALYFLVMFTASFLVSKKLGFSYEETASLSFTAAATTSSWPSPSRRGLRDLVRRGPRGRGGPLIEVPALLALVYLSLWLKRRLFGEVDRGRAAGRSGKPHGGRAMKTILFACVHNAGRSQMAAAWFNGLADTSTVRAVSAGTKPGPRVHPVVVDAMNEVGIDLSNERPTLLDQDLARTASLLITMGCGEACPVVPGIERDDWPLEDPKGHSIEHVREIRDDIRTRIERLLDERRWVRPA